MEKLDYNKDVLTLSGSMNYLVQIFDEKDESDEEDDFAIPHGMVQVNIYQPRKNNVWSGQIDREEAREKIIETIERMKIAINHFQEYLDGERNTVYYWENKEDENK